ncbi:hypothetical protein GGTG_08335 [Gaeumannomyces tritici R3-111a-1]|uniref:Uncharacterized protein n=1 Tax=Gaeumannomyces tritici (strain R3-111a-1) TaxID=644352 RepID=J3P499_GAET3|nr:hypothetical protein GGTG_08335 [Gaeumannomyces tritici R3-111a-1]EJT74495.1 hypothetical protein GGTG_08335 [Gaeumannomyces tritici R3-111a-1]
MGENEKTTAELEVDSGKSTAERRTGRRQWKSKQVMHGQTERQRSCSPGGRGNLQLLACKDKIDDDSPLQSS